MADSSASEWGFLRLIIGLDTALLGGLVYGKEKIIHIASTKWVLAAGIVMLVGSLFASIVAAQALISVDSWREYAAEFRRLNPAFGLDADQQRYLDAKLKRFGLFLRSALWLLWVGVLSGMVFFLWNTLR